MKLKSIYRLALLGGVVALAGCSGEEFAGASDEGIVPESVTVTLTVSRPGGASTRTQLEENGDGTLTSTWTTGDKLLVVTSEGARAGELTLTEGAGSQSGIFTGNLSIADGTRASLWYLGAKNGTASPYTEAREADGKVTLTMDLTSLGTEFEDLKRAELLTYDNVVFTVKNNMGYVQTKGITLNQKMAMAHFTLTFPSEDFTLSEDATLRVSSESAGLPNKKTWLPTGASADDDYDYTFTLGASDSDGKDIVVKDNKADLYIPIIPTSDSYKYKLKFDVTSNGKEYTYTLKNESEIKAGVYYTSGKPSDDASSSLYAGISVPLYSPVVVDDDLVGPVFTVNGKKIRFTRANLKYDIDTETWSLFDNQYDFLGKSGWHDQDGKYISRIDISTGNTPNWKNLPAEAKVIDLFGYGATGLLDEKQGVYAQKPQYYLKTPRYARAGVSETTEGRYYPTNTTTINEGYTGSYLDDGVQGKVYDWGTAYGKGRTDALSYFTLSASNWRSIANDYYIVGATITDAINPATNAKGINGCMIFGIKDPASVRQLFIGDNGEKLVEHLETTFPAGNEFLSDNQGNPRDALKFDYTIIKMTKAQFDELDKRNQFVFLPEAGHRASYSLTTTEGYYWTSTNGQSYTARYFRFYGGTSNKHFVIDRVSRMYGCSVRLVKEVTDDKNQLIE